MPYKCNAKGNLIQTKTLTLYIITPRGFRRQASPRRGKTGRFTLTPEAPSCQRFSAAGPRCIKTKTALFSVVDLQIKPVAVSDNVTVSLVSGYDVLAYSFRNMGRNSNGKSQLHQ